MLERIIEFCTRITYKRLVKKVKKGSGVVITAPFTITNIENFEVGDYVYVGPNAWISTYGKVRVGNGVIIGPRLKVYTGNHHYDSTEYIPYDEITIAKNVLIGDNVWIGGDVTILPGVVIEEGAIIGACSVVTKNVPQGAIVGGNPAKILKYRDWKKYEELKMQGKVYLKYKLMGKTQMKVKNESCI